jgi:alpha-beta hydrolase superfamily lysophospholipase
MGKHDGLAYSLWVPDGARQGVVILHGAGSCKESHHDFARAARGAGMAAIAFDLRGHGESDSPMDGRALEDVSSMASLLRSGVGESDMGLALRGSSMGGYLAILAAPLVGAGAVVAICPASASGLRRGLEAGALRFEADGGAVSAFLESHDLNAAVEDLDVPLLLMHAEGDEQVPVQHSRELAERAHAPGSRLIALPGGHHRSIQHDDELQAVSLRFIARALGPPRPG